MPLMTTFGAGSVRGLGRAARLVPPGVPTSFTATGRARLNGDGGANVFFTAPVDNGGAPILYYELENSNTGSVQQVYSSGQLISLSNNVEHTFRIRAVNAAGPSAWSNTDTALAGYWTYNPGNGGGSTTFTVPSGVSILSYQLFGNGGATSKPDTRVYANYWQTDLYWYGQFNRMPGHESLFLPNLTQQYHRSFDSQYWWCYDDQWGYHYGYTEYWFGNASGGGIEYYRLMEYSPSYGTYRGEISVYGYTNIQQQVGGSPAAGPSYGTATTISVPGWGSDSSGQGYNGSQGSTTGTAYPSSGANVTVTVGYTQGDYSYSTPGYAVIAYSK